MKKNNPSTKHPIENIDQLKQHIRDLEKQLEELKIKEDFNKYLNIAGVMFIAINAKGIITLINKKGCEILGYDKNEIIGKNWFENFLPPGWPRM